jgi:hypothetical protein
MKHNLELKVQAWVDGELSDRQARRIGEWIAREAEASALAAELGSARRTMCGNEHERAVPEARGFYWSKIERQITCQARQGLKTGMPWWHARWKRLLAPVAGALALTFLLLIAAKKAGFPTYDELSVTGENMEAVTFHDQSAQMTVVWLQENTPAASTKQQNQKTVVPTQDDPGVDLE